MDYDDEYETVSRGEFSIRGGIVDIFSPLYDHPARIEFFGDTVESIKFFDVNGQRTFRAADEYRIIPLCGGGGTGESGKNVSTLFPADKTAFVFCHPELCSARALRFFGDEGLTEWKRIEASPNSVFILDSVESADIAGGENCSSLSHPEPAAHVSGRFLSREEGQSQVVEKIEKLLQDSYSVFVGARDEDSARLLSEWLAVHFSSNSASVIKSAFPHPFILPDFKIAYLTEDEALAVPFRRLPSFSEERGLKKGIRGGIKGESFFSGYDEGDYVVHNDYGMGIFRGIKEKNYGGAVIETLAIEFADDVVTYTPLYRAELVGRYSGAGKIMPPLSKIGGKNWVRMKRDAKRSVAGFASEMLKVQALRMKKSGLPCRTDTGEELIFERSFPFSETPDQRSATDEIKKDMQSYFPMDRLLCGDAGYGKTEVAMRAAFKSVMSGRQVAVLVPTTILAQQHYYTFAERFAEYPVNIDMLSRFKSRSEQQEIIRRIEDSKIDIIIGTHRLIQGDVNFKNLGLLVIDEEQRFGVEHKERLKIFRSSVHVLSMSATPIPRTLYMAMTGIRDLSSINTPPSQRQAVITYISKENEKIIADAITFELERGGQIFFLHNRVKSIDSAAIRLAKIAPSAKIAIAHGQMPEDELEKTMASFMEGRTDILCCTTIIESGIDVPNANTLIIERADRFGLAELYQLRGRVGRGARQAYAYFLLPQLLMLTGAARERISAIKKYSRLGAGFRIALRDLEIRGSGNLIGAEQSGHINAVGFELYCHYLKMAASELKGERAVSFEDCSIAIDFISFGFGRKSPCLTAYIPSDYISSETLKIHFYRKLGLCETERGIDDIILELTDRFGKIPDSALNMADYHRIRIRLTKSGYDTLQVAEKKVTLSHSMKGEYFLVNGRPPVLRAASPKAMAAELLSCVLPSNPKQ
jgi:transcription-repair coupling factor (superfamily II helicase)